MQTVSQSPEETRAFGQVLGELLRPGDVIGLSGNLGAGKTVLAQGIGLGLGVSEVVCSPTFALVHEYAGRVPVWHLDTYRVASLDELADLSWDDLLHGGGVVVVEWPERIEAALPPERLELRLAYGPDETTRAIEWRPHGKRGQELAAALAAAWPGSETDAGSGD